MAETSAKLNRTCSITRFKMKDNMFKDDFLGSGSKKITPTGKLAYALISSLSTKNKPAFLTYNNYHEVLNCSTKTTRKFISELTESGAIKQDKSNRMYSKYTVEKRPKGRGYTTYDQAYFDIINEHAKTPVHWTNSRKQIICRMIRHIISEGHETFSASNNKLANMVDISPRSARAGIAHFLDCKVIFRPAEYKGKYEGKPSEYTFGTALTIALTKHEEKVKEEAKAKAQAKRARAAKRVETAKQSEASEQDKPLSKWQEDIIAADMRAARERLFAIRRQKAQARTDKWIALANTDDAFNTATKTIREGEYKLARAELYAPHTLPEIQQKIAEAKRVRAEALLRLHLTEEDLLPQWTCKECSDTGFLPNGKICRCDSPPPRGAP